MNNQENLGKKTIFIIEHIGDISEYQKIRDTINGIHIIIAATPYACWGLEKNNIPFIGIEQYYIPDDVYTLGLENYSMIDKMCSDVDAIFGQFSPYLKTMSFFPTKDNFYYFKLLFDNLTIRILILNTIIQKETPECIITFSSRDDNKLIRNSFFFPFSDEESIFSQIALMKGWPCKTIVIPRKNDLIVEKAPRFSNIEVTHTIKKFFRKHPCFFIPLFTLKNFGIRKTLEIIIYQIRNSLRSNNVLLMIRQEPSWSSAIFHLYEGGFQVLFLQEIDEISQNEIDFESELENRITECLWPYSVFQNIDISEILKKHFKKVIIHYLKCSASINMEIEKEIIQSHPVAFLCSEKATFIEHVFCHIARKHKIPVIAWQHGDGPFYPPMQIYVEIMNSDVHLSYGPGHKSMLRAAPDNHFSCRIESVGSCILENLHFSSPKPKDKRKILYVTTGFHYNNLYVNSYPVNDNQLWKHQKEILYVLGKSGNPVIFKLNPDNYANTFIFEYIQVNHFDTIVLIRHEKTFLELLRDADIVICDYPSTPVIEAIAAKKTVFVLLNSPYLRNEALMLLKKRVYWSDSIHGFVRLISDYLENKPLTQSPDPDNIEYLETFGVHKLDGNVAQRAIDILKREINKPSD